MLFGYSVKTSDKNLVFMSAFHRPEIVSILLEGQTDNQSDEANCE